MAESLLIRSRPRRHGCAPAFAHQRNQQAGHQQARQRFQQIQNSSLLPCAVRQRALLPGVHSSPAHPQQTRTAHDYLHGPDLQQRTAPAQGRVQIQQRHGRLLRRICSRSMSAQFRRAAVRDPSGERETSSLQPGLLQHPGHLPCSPTARNRTTATVAATRPATTRFPDVSVYSFRFLLLYVIDFHSDSIVYIE